MDRCPNLRNLDALSGLTGLQTLELSGCTQLRNVDGLRGLTGLQNLKLIFCTELQDVDALKNLTGLQELDLRGCDKIPTKSLSELGAALPNTDIRFPIESENLPR